MEKGLTSLARKYCEHFAGACECTCSLLDVAARQIVFSTGDEMLCQDCDLCSVAFRKSDQPSHYLSPHLYGCYEAERWGGKYIYYCPAGLIFIASPLADENGLCGGIVVGPIIMSIDASITPDTIESEHMQELIARKYPVMSTRRVNDISKILALTTSFICGKKYSETQQDAPVNIGDFNNLLYNLSESNVGEGGEKSPYPIEIETQLQSMIAQGDKAAAQELLNSLLGHIFFSSGGNFELIKARVYELIVLLSRASIQGGADVDQVFWLNSNYFKEINHLTTIEDLSFWLSGVMVRFSSYAFDFVDVKHTDIIFKAVDYIKTYYATKITLDDIASHVYLSKSYLSKIFKNEMNCNLSTYINNIRVEKSKQLLLDYSVSLVDIANMVGFDDQSYFTKVFKKTVGISPGKFREKRGQTRIISTEDSMNE